MPERRSGFTLIELLIVVVIIGILAAIAAPKFNSSKGRANMSVMRSDLHNMAVAQEAYMYDENEYATNPANLAFNFSTGVKLVGGAITVSATKAGWSAKVTHDQAFPKTCALFVGDAAAVTPAVKEGVIGCDN